MTWVFCVSLMCLFVDMCGFVSVFSNLLLFIYFGYFFGGEAGRPSTF